MSVGKIVAGLAATALLPIVAAFPVLDGARENLESLFEWIDTMGAWGRVWFVAIYVLLVILMIPSFPVTLAGGFLFGVVEGSAHVILSMMIGAACAFAIARWLLSERVAEKIRHHPRLEGLSEGIGEEGWKIIMLCRLIPFFPAKMSNYFFALSSVRFVPFMVGNFIGLLPWTVTNVYIGSLAASLARLGEHERATWEWTLYALGLAAVAGLAFYVTRIAQRSMDQGIKRQNKRH